MRILGVDAGLENTGCGVIDTKSGGRILHSETITTKPSLPVKGSSAVLVASDQFRRAHLIADRVLGMAMYWGCERIALELFGDQGSTRNAFLHRAGTAGTVHQIYAELRRQYAENMIHIVDSAVVASAKGSMRPTIEMWQRGVHVFDGDERLREKVKSRDHERDACAHALLLGTQLTWEERTRQ